MLNRALPLIALATIVAGQDPQKPEPFPPGIFEVISVNVPYTTYRLNRFTGQVFQMVGNSRDKYHWKEMEVVDRSNDFMDEPRYQLLLLDPNYIFLLDTASGKTWVLLTDTRGTRWQPLPPDEKSF